MIRLKRNINDELVRAYVLACMYLVIFVQFIAFNSRVFLNFSREKWNSRVNRGILLVYFKVKISKFQSFIFGFRWKVGFIQKCLTYSGDKSGNRISALSSSSLKAFQRLRISSNISYIHETLPLTKLPLASSPGCKRNIYF